MNAAPAPASRVIRTYPVPNGAEEARAVAVIDRVLDEVTVALLRAESPATVLVRVDYEERAGRSVYDPLPKVAPRDLLARCGAPGCDRRFWQYAQAGPKLYCSDRCRTRAWYWTQDPETRRAINRGKVQRRAERLVERPAA